MNRAQYHETLSAPPAPPAYASGHPWNKLTAAIRCRVRSDSHIDGGGLCIVAEFPEGEIALPIYTPELIELLGATHPAVRRSARLTYETICRGRLGRREAAEARMLAAGWPPGSWR